MGGQQSTSLCDVNLYPHRGKSVMDGVRMGERDSTETKFKGYYRNPPWEKNFLEQ